MVKSNCGAHKAMGLGWYQQKDICFYGMTNLGDGRTSLVARNRVQGPGKPTCWTESERHTCSGSKNRIVCSLKRFIRRDNRSQSMRELHSIVANAREKSRDLMDSKFLNPDINFMFEAHVISSQLRTLRNYIEDATAGLGALKMTYGADPNAVAQLDLIQAQMTRIICDVDACIDPSESTEVSTFSDTGGTVERDAYKADVGRYGVEPDKRVSSSLLATGETAVGSKSRSRSRVQV
jgi:hypothetical protein